jgi:hypothetical protein
MKIKVLYTQSIFEVTEWYHHWSKRYDYEGGVIIKTQYFTNPRWDDA